MICRSNNGENLRCFINLKTVNRLASQFLGMRWRKKIAGSNESEAPND